MTQQIHTLELLKKVVASVVDGPARLSFQEHFGRPLHEVLDSRSFMVHGQILVLDLYRITGRYSGPKAKEILCTVDTALQEYNKTQESTCLNTCAVCRTYSLPSSSLIQVHRSQMALVCRPCIRELQEISRLSQQVR